MLNAKLDVDAKIRSINARINTLKAEMDFYYRVKYNNDTRRPFSELYANITKHQQQIVELIRKGGTIKTVASDMRLTPKGIKWHLTKIYANFDVCKRKELIAYLNANKEAYEQASNGLCPGPAKGSTESCIRRLQRSTSTDSTRGTLPLGSTTKAG